jgi:hypothetical protein
MEASGQLYAPVALIPLRSCRYPWNMILVGPKRGSGRLGKDINLFSSPGIRSPDYPACRLVFTLIALPQLLSLTQTTAEDLILHYSQDVILGPGNC